MRFPGSNFILFCLAGFAVVEVSGKYKDHCLRDVTKGRAMLQKASGQMISEAFHTRQHRMQSIKARMHKLMSIRAPLVSRDDVDCTQLNCTAPVCPSPAPTMFPPPPTYFPPTPSKPTTTTTVVTNPTTSGGDSGTGATDDGTMASDEPVVTGSDGPVVTGATMVPTNKPETEAEEDKKPAHKKFTFFASTPEDDPFALLVDAMHYYMDPENGVCEEANFEDLNSLSEHHLFGTIAQMATVHAGPFCNLCERFMTTIEEKILTPNPLSLNPSEVLIRQIFHAYLPQPHLLCSAIAPACYDKYQSVAAKRNITTGVICAECTLCQAGLNVVFHKFLLNKEAVAHFKAWMHKTVFTNICAEFCLADQGPLAIQFITCECFTMDKCTGFFDRTLDHVLTAMTTILKPERFCVLDLGWCEVNEVPNLIHCLRELCEEALGGTAAFNWLCSQIPDRPDLADAYLNVQETKIYKTMKPYHHEYLKQFKEEL